ncbi:MAG: BON domain-containing protein, partial [Acidobacteriota bacterium]
MRVPERMLRRRQAEPVAAHCRYDARGRCLRLVVLAAACGAIVGCGRAIDPQLITDAQTAVRVKTAIVNDADLGQRAIEVRVSRGVARLTGVVWTAAE